MATPRSTSLAELTKRLERLEGVRLVPLITVAAVVRDEPLYPGHDGRRRGIPGYEPDMLVRYPGRAPRPLKPGELQRLREHFGKALPEPFVPRLGTLRHDGHRDDGDGDD